MMLRQMYFEWQQIYSPHDRAMDIVWLQRRYGLKRNTARKALNIMWRWDQTGYRPWGGQRDSDKVERILDRDAQYDPELWVRFGSSTPGNSLGEV